MPKKNKLYQCPYEIACECDLTEPCLGCETWAEHSGKFYKLSTNEVSHEIITLQETVDVLKRVGDTKIAISIVEKLLCKLRVTE